MNQNPSSRPGAFLEVVVRISSFVDAFILDWIWGDTLSPILNDLVVLAWPLRLGMDTCCLSSPWPHDGNSMGTQNIIVGVLKS